LIFLLQWKNKSCCP